MKLIERNGIRILVPTYGYVLKHKTNGNIFQGKIYLGKHVSMDEYEEVEDKKVNMSLLYNFEVIEQKEQSLTKIGKIVANQVTDDTVALTIKEFYDVWEVGVIYSVGRYITYDDVLYKVLVDHTSQETWTPDVSPGLFAKVLIDPSGETVLDWVRPDSTNGYSVGDKVKFEGNIYESLIDNNIWSPTEYPAGWKQL